MRTVVVAVAASAVIVAGYASQRTFELSRVDLVDQLRPGVTTISEAQQMLGTATSSSRYTDGSTLLQWLSYESTASGPKGAHVVVLFEPSGLMAGVTHRFAMGQ